MIPYSFKLAQASTRSELSKWCFFGAYHTKAVSSNPKDLFKAIMFRLIQGIIAEKGLDVKLSRDNVIPSLNGSI